MRRGRYVKACLLCEPNTYTVDQDEIGSVQHCGKPGIPCLMASEHPHTILARYYFNMEQTKTASESNIYREARMYLARAPLTLIYDIARAVGTSVISVIRLLKDNLVIRLMNKVGWSFSKLMSLVRNGLADLKLVVKSIIKFIRENGLTKSAVMSVTWIDAWITENPNLARVGVGALMLAAWLSMSYKGDPSDLDFSDVMDAFNGNFSLKDWVASGDAGEAIALIAHNFAGMSVEFPVSDQKIFIVAVVLALMKYASVRMERPKMTPEEEMEALNLR